MNFDGIHGHRQHWSSLKMSMFNGYCSSYHSLNFIYFVMMKSIPWRFASVKVFVYHFVCAINLYFQYYWIDRKVARRNEYKMWSLTGKLLQISYIGHIHKFGQFGAISDSFLINPSPISIPFIFLREETMNFLIQEKTFKIFRMRAMFSNSKSGVKKIRFSLN